MERASQRASEPASQRAPRPVDPARPQAVRVYNPTIHPTIRARTDWVRGLVPLSGACSSTNHTEPGVRCRFLRFSVRPTVVRSASGGSMGEAYSVGGERGRQAGKGEWAKAGDERVERTTGWPWPPLSNANGNIWNLYYGIRRDNAGGSLVSADFSYFSSRGDHLGLLVVVVGTAWSIRGEHPRHTLSTPSAHPQHTLSTPSAHGQDLI